MSMRSLAAVKDESEKVVKKADMFRAKYSALRVEHGHNSRNMNSAATKEHIQNFYNAIINRNIIPPLDVRVDVDDQIWIVDGECRYTAYGMAIEAGHPIEWIDVFHFTGNDAERTQKMLTSNQGLALTPLEISIGYKKLVRIGWDEEMIAKGCGRSKERVKQLLVLANANVDVQKYVADGVLSADEAIDIVRKHGEKSGDYIAGELASAEAKGKTKLTKSGIQGRALPKKVVSSLVDTMQTFASKLDSKTRRSLAALESATEEQLVGKVVEVDASALLSLMRAQAAVDEAKARNDEKVRQQEEAGKQEVLEV